MREFDGMGFGSHESAREKRVLSLPAEQRYKSKSKSFSRARKCGNAKVKICDDSRGQIEWKMGKNTQIGTVFRYLTSNLVKSQ